MNDVNVTVVGNVAADPVVRDTANGRPVTAFSVAATPRRLNRATGEWGDGPTSWYQVSCWDDLGKNVADSLFRGQRVVVHGRLTIEKYVKDGVERTSAQLTADSVGHDLRYGTSKFTKRERLRSGEQREDEPVDGAEPEHDFDALTGELVDEELTRA